MDFSLFYFAADAGEASENKYRLLLEGARYADQHGFSAVWTPERHFHAFGGLYPNPAVTSAAVAAITSRVQIRAGSVVLPLHNPIRVAEEWSVVDNLSQGRVGLSFASGWHANDFALMPQNYKERKEVMVRGIDTIRRLWRGEAVEAESGNGAEIEVRIFPAPLQREPQIWLTAAGNIDTFRMAGQYRCQHPHQPARAEGRGAWREDRRLSRGPARARTSRPGARQLDAAHIRRARSRRSAAEGPDTLPRLPDDIHRPDQAGPLGVPSVRDEARPANRTRSMTASSPTPRSQAIMDHAFERYFQSSGLFGTPEMCLQMVERLHGDRSRRNRLPDRLRRRQRIGARKPQVSQRGSRAVYCPRRPKAITRSRQ